MIIETIFISLILLQFCSLSILHNCTLFLGSVTCCTQGCRQYYFCELRTFSPIIVFYCTIVQQSMKILYYRVFAIEIAIILFLAINIAIILRSPILIQKPTSRTIHSDVNNIYNIPSVITKHYSGITTLITVATKLKISSRLIATFLS